MPTGYQQLTAGTQSTASLHPGVSGSRAYEAVVTSLAEVTTSTFFQHFDTCGWGTGRSSGKCHCFCSCVSCHTDHAEYSLSL